MFTFLSIPFAFRHWRLWTALAIAFALLAVLPAYAGIATQRLLVEVFTVFAMAMACNLLAGYGGMVVVGQHVFVGVGAYALFWFSGTFGLNPWWTLPIAALVTLLFALASAAPLFRLSGAQLTVATWVLAELARIAVLNCDALGAGSGLPLVAMRDFPRDLRSAGVYWAALAVGFGTLLLARALLVSRLGLALASVRDAEAAAQASGVSIMRSKLALWLLATLITGCAGAVAYMNTLQVSPDASFGLSWTAAALFIAVLGGIGTIEGPFVGTLIYFVLREFAADYGAWYFIALGTLAIATMVVSPGGAWRLLTRRWPRLDLFGVRRGIPADD